MFFGSSESKSKKVLLVEDEAPLRNVLKERLSQMGFEVSFAEDGEQALEMLKEFRPDVVVLDIYLPKVDGNEVLGEIRKMDRWGRNLPVIMLTSYDPSVESVNLYKDLNPCYYLIKTQVQLDEIIEKIREVA